MALVSITGVNITIGDVTPAGAATVMGGLPAVGDALAQVIGVPGAEIAGAPTSTLNLLATPQLPIPGVAALPSGLTAYTPPAPAPAPTP